MTDSEIYPLRLGYAGDAPKGLVYWVRLVLEDWDGKHWDAVRFNIQDYYEERGLNPQTPVVDWTLSEIHQHYAQRNKRIIDTTGKGPTHAPGPNSKATFATIRTHAEPVSEPRKVEQHSSGAQSKWSGFHPPGDWYDPFGMNPTRWRKSLRETWIPNGDAERDSLTPSRGDVRFQLSLLNERGVNEPNGG